MPARATLRGAERTPIAAPDADVLICGASFAGLAVARELAGSGADVLVVDRYEIGERQTSACACPTPWLEVMGVAGSIKQEIPHMAFHTPFGRARYRLPWSWSSFDYRTLCRLLWEQCDGARFEIAKVEGRADASRVASHHGTRAAAPVAVATDRGTLRAPLVIDALGWRRVLGADGYQPPEAPLSRGLEVHPDGGGTDLDIWIDRSLVRRGYTWSVPAEGEQRVGAGSYDPHQHVKQPTVEMARRLDVPAVRYQGNWFPHRLRRAAADDVFFAGDSAGHCFPLSGEGIRTAFYFGIACGREVRGVLGDTRSRDEALRRYARFSGKHRRAFGWALALQRLIPALSPRVLTVLFKAMAPQPIVNRAFGWYLDQAHPDFAAQRDYAATGEESSTPTPSLAHAAPSHSLP